MSASPARWGSTAPVLPQPAALADVVEEVTAAAHRRTLRTLDPGRNLVAALLNLDTAEAAEVLAMVRTTDFDDHLNASIFAMLRVIVTERGQQPTPQAVYALARGLSERLGELQLSVDRVAQYVVEVYSLGNPLTVWADARQVVEDAYRRNLGAIGTRLAQMADAYASIADLEKVTGNAVRDWKDQRARLAALTKRASHF
ncbi:hypothetical protein JK358_38300 [Nocardia sp. 2]|uniref:DnaB helicase-like protein n=1 Tax=Nocardia acididurans TaxID=2802282 RepID=A0ABS1MI53_9NOCA|nr:hypothetical protein [Nocardia acididurans]MBL1080264.1 hypothetical protein [Nocardia acididurans]